MWDGVIRQGKRFGTNPVAPIVRAGEGDIQFMHSSHDPVYIFDHSVAVDFIVAGFLWNKSSKPFDLILIGCVTFAIRKQNITDQ